MEFQIYNVEQKSDTEVYIYGKDISSNEPGMQTIKITNIISPFYFLPSKNHKDDLLRDLKEFASDIINVEFVQRTNIFYKSCDKNLNLFKVTFSKKVSFQNFDSEFCELVISEFTNPVENFIISRNIKGPGIIKIDNLVKNSAKIEDVTFLRNAKFPKLQTASIAFELKNNTLSKFVYYNNFKKSYFKASLGKANETGGRSFSDSREILSYLNEVIKNDSAEIILVHNFHMKSKINIRDKIFCDIYAFATGTIKGRDFSIFEICALYKINKLKGLEGDCLAMIEIFEAMNALNLAKEMAEISGYILNKSLNNCRAERIEYTLLHELYSKNYLFPSDTPKTNVKYSGGLVLEPSQGFYEDIVLLLDFNSLYPSIIQEYNVCFSNIGSGNFYISEDNDKEFMSNPDLLSSINDTQNETFLPKILLNLVKRRRAVKDLIKNCKNKEELAILDIRQKALKLTANSIYGCLGSPISRFCNFEMAAFITAKGRELLNETKTIAENMGMKVIYGDTDSIMIHTKYPGCLNYYNQAIESAKILVTRINSKYKNIEIETEKVFKKLILYTKKKYAALVFNKQGSFIESKGLDLVRRDFCLASSDINRMILNIMLQDRENYENEGKNLLSETSTIEEPESLKNDTKETAEKIYKICIDFYNTLQKRPLDDFIISTLLSKDLSLYTSASMLPHIALARRLKEQKNILYVQDDIISYVIGEGEGSISARAFHPDENFKIDYLYYIKNQILPSIFRLINVLKFIHAEKIFMIFNVKNFTVKTITKTLTFFTPCCENIQEPGSTCIKCNSLIPKNFYITRVLKLLKEAASKCYKTKGECLDCGMLYSNHLFKCLNCHKNLKFDFNNQEFDDLLTSIETSFSKLDIPQVMNIVVLYSSISSYRNIDLTKYFKEEILNYQKTKSY